MKKIGIAFAPNAQKDDIAMALKLLVSPWKWFGHKYRKQLEHKFSSYINQSSVAFDSGRSALYALLKSYNIKAGDEIALQAFTCVALPNPILWTGATPIYIDVDKSNFNIDLKDLQKKITSKTKALIVQYTFGICPDMESIKTICEKEKILLIEDCCHNLGQLITINGKTYKSGTIGDAAIFSFGMEKVISGTRGGLATAKNPQILERLKKIQIELKAPRIREIIRGMINPIAWKAKENMAAPGELFFKLLIKMKLLDYGLTRLELVGKKASWLPYRLPEPNAKLIINQLGKIKKYNDHRKKIAAIYLNQINNSDEYRQSDKLELPNKELANKFAESIWLRFPVIVDNPQKYLSKAENFGIYLGNWYSSVIHCKDVDLNAMKYKEGSCPQAEWLAKHTINLPTHISIDTNQAKSIIAVLS